MVYSASLRLWRYAEYLYSAYPKCESKNSVNTLRKTIVVWLFKVRNTLVKENSICQTYYTSALGTDTRATIRFEELMSVIAVRERFELPDPFGSSVFKTDGLSHSPTLPCCPPERAIVFCVFNAPRFTALVVVSRGNPPRKAFPVIRRTRQTFFCAKVSDRATLHSPQAYYYPRTF